MATKADAYVSRVWENWFKEVLCSFYDSVLILCSIGLSMNSFKSDILLI